MRNLFISIILGGLILSVYQNCAVYESEGRKALENSVLQKNSSCLPYLDVNFVFQTLNTNSVNLALEYDSSTDTHFCTITDRNAVPSDRQQVICSFGPNEKSLPDLSVLGEPASLDELYNAYCSLSNQSSNPFLCEHISSSVDSNRDLLAKNIGFIEPQDYNLFLSYFKLNPQSSGLRGFGYSGYTSNSTLVSVKLSDATDGVTCLTNFPIKALNLSLNNERLKDFNSIKEKNDILRLSQLGAEILRNK